MITFTKVIDWVSGMYAEPIMISTYRRMRISIIINITATIATPATAPTIMPIGKLAESSLGGTGGANEIHLMMISQYNNTTARNLLGFSKIIEKSELAEDGLDCLFLCNKLVIITIKCL